MPNARLFKTEAVVLSQRRLGEADRFLTLLTPGLGKFDVKAKGVRKTTSRMSGHLQPLTHCALQIAEGHQLGVVTGVETMESFPRLRSDLDRLSLALYTAELVSRITPEHSPSVPTFRLLLDALGRIDEGSHPWAATRYFEMQLLDQSGYRPELNVCVACGKPLEPVDNYFAPIAGGAVCASCVPGLAGPRPLTLNALKFLRLLRRGTYNEVVNIRVDDLLGSEVERHLRGHIITVLERDVNAAAFVERLRRDGPARAGSAVR